MHSSQDGSDIVADRCIIGGSAIIADKEVPLQWRAVVRDCGVYLASLVVLIIMLLDGKISQVILPPAPAVSNEGRSSELLAPLPALSRPWVSACDSLEPPRRDGENAQNNGGKRGKNGRDTV